MIQNKLTLTLSVSENLKSIPGFGPYVSDKLCFKLGINPQSTLSSLSSHKRDAFIRLLTEISRKNTFPGKYKSQWDSPVPQLLVDSSLRDFIKQSKKKQIALNTIKGSKLNRGLPCRGQRTKTNARTAKKRL